MPDSSRQEVDVARLYATTNAAVWAEEFCRLFVVCTSDDLVDDDRVGLMIGWFANAIETGRQAGYEQGYADGQRETSHALMGLTDA